MAERIKAAVPSVKIAGKPIYFGVLPCGYPLLDVDTFAIDSSGAVKEHVSVHPPQSSKLKPTGDESC